MQRTVGSERLVKYKTEVASLAPQLKQCIGLKRWAVMTTSTVFNVTKDMSTILNDARWCLLLLASTPELTLDQFDASNVSR